MLEPAVVLLRLMQYAAAAVLMGASLFLVFAAPAAAAGARSRLLAGAAGLLAIAALLGLGAQTATMAGSVADGLRPDALAAVITGTGLGMAAVVRAACAALAAILLLVAPPGRTAWLSAGALGTVAVASFAWMGHGAATEGPGHLLHLTADILHAWAAAIWVGALVMFVVMVRERQPSPEASRRLHRALHRFSGVGTALVATLVATGLVNSAFLVGLERIDGLWTTPYGRLLCLKLAVFAGMLALAAANRFRLTPALGQALQSDPQGALAALKRSLMVEAACGFAALALVAWFGTLVPPAAG